MSTALAPANEAEQEDGLTIGGTSSYAMTVRLKDMRDQVEIVRAFFQSVMNENEDYGKIPGTQKATLLKPGAEKLCELYGFAITMREIAEVTDRESGYYRARVTVGLMSRRTGALVAEGVGEANTNEGRYRWRWMPHWKMPNGIDTSGLVSERRGAKNTLFYRMENDDPWALWNTVLKMAKKRALVDATLSATRSSGLFTQDAEEMARWLDDDGGDVPHAGAAAADSPPVVSATPQRDWKNYELTNLLKEHGLASDDLCPELGVEKITNLRQHVDLYLIDNPDRTLADLVESAARRIQTVAGDPSVSPATPAPAAVPEWHDQFQALMKAHGLELKDLMAVLPVNRVDEQNYVDVINDYLLVQGHSVAHLVAEVAKAKETVKKEDDLPF